MEDLPPNSHKAQDVARGPRNIERVTSAKVVRRRRPLGKQFASTFFGGDARTAFGYMIEGVLIPAAREAIVEGVTSLVEKIVYNDSRPRRGGAPPSVYGRVDYRSKSSGHPADPRSVSAAPTVSRGSRARHDFGELVLQSRAEAQEVIDQMRIILDQYDMVLVADLYALTGIQSGHTDHKWGWTSLHGAEIGRVRGGGGYVLDLPAPVPLDR